MHKVDLWCTEHSAANFLRREKTIARSMENTWKDESRKRVLFTELAGFTASESRRDEDDFNECYNRGGTFKDWLSVEYKQDVAAEIVLHMADLAKDLWDEHGLIPLHGAGCPSARTTLLKIIFDLRRKFPQVELWTERCNPREKNAFLRSKQRHAACKKAISIAQPASLAHYARLFKNCETALCDHIERDPILARSLTTRLRAQKASEVSVLGFMGGEHMGVADMVASRMNDTDVSCKLTPYVLRPFSKAILEEQEKPDVFWLRLFVFYQVDRLMKASVSPILHDPEFADEIDETIIERMADDTILEVANLLFEPPGKKTTKRQLEKAASIISEAAYGKNAALAEKIRRLNDKINGVLARKPYIFYRRFHKDNEKRSGLLTALLE